MQEEWVGVKTETLSLKKFLWPWKSAMAAVISIWGDVVLAELKVTFLGDPVLYEHCLQ